ncbi:ABC-type cobalt transport system, ATPase component [Bellilinea caldifistulae]|uniref:Cobalt ABC transporter ATP-binding protein n=1 Tax=Bellilinea caldifistulae TaxID=360411 RepID=A0A0P6YAJ6_9CHLR|nr:ABC transporter ATP-binding protein [Bellilinea caldifistulae]KPL78905.1 cobalt ABC transporter ATP-binding protein [Bellilinea caldifistulae]GAP09141.1 ABC-type cobalt transport system, ATPase component [Bellilinea caldifistulae]
MNPFLEVENLTYTYPDGRPALRGIGLKILPGERVALVGPNGAGKSTLLLALAGILRAEGRILVDGTLLTPASLPRLRARIGLVFQLPDDQLFSPTVYEDVAFAPLYQDLPPGEVHARVEEALAGVGMQAFAGRMPHHLSMGEKKRVAIATVLAMRPAMLLLDEPSAGLDPRGRRELISLLNGLPQTLLIATHDLDLAGRLCPRMVILDGGQIVADGESRALLADADLLAAHGLV